MTAKRLFRAVAITLLILVVYNVVIYFAVKKSQRRQLLAAVDRLPPATECIFLGNSLIAAGCDATAFKSGWPHASTNEPPVALNLGLGDTTPAEHYMILKRALSRPQHVKYVVYGFLDDQLVSPVRGDWVDLVGNRAFSYYFPNEAARFYAPNSWLGRCRIELVAHVPMLSDRSSLWERVELLRRKLDQVGMPSKKINRFGRVADFNTIDATTVPAFTERCHRVVHENKGFSAPIQAIVDLAEAHGVKVFFVEMPLSPKHRETFYSLAAWTEMRAHLQSLARNEHAVYVGASDWVRDGRNFEDAMHLNEQGARAFSAQLAVAMSQLVTGGTNETVLSGAPPSGSSVFKHEGVAALYVK